MLPLVLYCKSYRNDFHRLKQLAESVTRFNEDKIPFYVSVPRSDLPLFAPLSEELGFQLLPDEEILSRTFQTGKTREPRLAGNIMQQVVKSEFWRLEISHHYLIVDSDSWFIRKFRASDFLHPSGHPYTVINEGRHSLLAAARSGNVKFLRQFRELRETARDLFNRTGRLYDFAPTPCIWSSAVWRGLFENYAEPRGENFQDLIMKFSCETQWYGEYLLAKQPIPLFPIEPLFKCWHFQHDYDESVTLGENEDVIALNYLGIVKQSNWDHKSDFDRRKKRSWKTLWMFKR